jgi:hypothetical protein
VIAHLVCGLHRGIILRFLDGAIAVTRLDADRDYWWTVEGEIPRSRLYAPGFGRCIIGRLAAQPSCALLHRPRRLKRSPSFSGDTITVMIRSFVH